MLDGLFAIVGTAHVLTEDVDVAAYLEDWTGQYCAPAVAVVRPASTQQVADVVKLCEAHDIAVVPQGGRTGLCGGGVPLVDQPSVVISLTRMNAGP